MQLDCLNFQLPYLLHPLFSHLVDGVADVITSEWQMTVANVRID